MNSFIQIRKRLPTQSKNGDFVVACSEMKTNANISMLARSASCLGAKRFIITGRNRIDNHIARDFDIEVKHHQSLLPVVKKYKINGYKIIGLEQTTNSNNLYEYLFEDVPILLIVGNEAKGMDQEVLDCLDEVIEIPLFGRPHSLNVAVAATLCLFEYAKQRNFREVK